VVGSRGGPSPCSRHLQARRTRIRVSAPEGVSDLAGYGAGKAFFRDAAGCFYGIFNDQADRKEHHGWGWPADMFTRTGLVKWAGDGRRVGHARAPVHPEEVPLSAIAAAAAARWMRFDPTPRPAG